MGSAEKSSTRKEHKYIKKGQHNRLIKTTTKKHQLQIQKLRHTSWIHHEAKEMEISQKQQNHHYSSDSLRWQQGSSNHGLHEQEE